MWEGRGCSFHSSRVFLGGFFLFRGGSFHTSGLPCLLLQAPARPRSDPRIRSSCHVLADPLQLHVFSVCWNIEAVGKPGVQGEGRGSTGRGSVQEEGVHRERMASLRGNL